MMTTSLSDFKPRRKFCMGREEQEMIAFFDYCRAKAKRHPAYALAFHIPNERKASVARRMTLKRAGVRKGIPDICVPVSCGGYHALFIEMKVKPNRPSPEQIELLEHLNAAGNYARLAWSSKEAIEILDKYITGLL